MPLKKPPDYLLLFSFLVLISMGTIMIFSASPTMGLRFGDSYYYIKRHLLYLLLGLGALIVGLRWDYTRLQKLALPILFGSIFLLLLVYIPGVGRSLGGASRWLDFGPFSFQPSELAKFALILFLADFLAKKRDKLKNFKEGFLPPLLVVGFVAFLILRQPDLGTTLVVFSVALIMFFVAGVPLWQLGAVIALGLAAVFFLSWFSPYRRQRLLAFLNPWKDPSGIGFQIIQSLLAVGSGGFLGVGLGESRQKFFYLPQQFTDFIFAILCEELGFVGAAFVITFFILFTFRGFRIARLASTQFGAFLAVGIVSWIIVQALVNIGVVIGILPTTGIPLPFLSYGGTSLVILFFAVGVLLNISKQQIPAFSGGNLL